MESINILNSESKINKIDFKRIQKSNSKKTYEIVIKDAFIISSLSDTEIRIEITREVGFTPNGIFSIIVDGEAILKYEKKVGGVVIDNAYVSNNIREIIVETELMSYISAIISSISTLSGQLPLITPPVVII